MQSHLIRSALPECSEIFAQAFPITGKMVPKLMAFGIRRVFISNPAARAITSKNKIS
jgi:hypothetical protein